MKPLLLALLGFCACGSPYLAREPHLTGKGVKIAAPLPVRAKLTNGLEIALAKKNGPVINVTYAWRAPSDSVEAPRIALAVMRKHEQLTALKENRGAWVGGYADFKGGWLSVIANEADFADAVRALASAVREPACSDAMLDTLKATRGEDSPFMDFVQVTTQRRVVPMRPDELATLDCPRVREMIADLVAPQRSQLTFVGSLETDLITAAAKSQKWPVNTPERTLLPRSHPGLPTIALRDQKTDESVVVVLGRFIDRSAIDVPLHRELLGIWGDVLTAQLKELEANIAPVYSFLELNDGVVVAVTLRYPNTEAGRMMVVRLNEAVVNRSFTAAGIYPSHAIRLGIAQRQMRAYTSVESIAGEIAGAFIADAPFNATLLRARDLALEPFEPAEAWVRQTFAPEALTLLLAGEPVATRALAEKLNAGSLKRRVVVLGRTL